MVAACSAQTPSGSSSERRCRARYLSPTAMAASSLAASRLSVGHGPPQSRYVTIRPPREGAMRGGFGMWCVGICLLFAGAAVAQGWTAYSPEGGRYRVDMPGAPKVDTAPIPVGPGQIVPMTEAG